jgi:hypothetical protein
VGKPDANAKIVAPSAVSAAREPEVFGPDPPNPPGTVLTKPPPNKQNKNQDSPPSAGAPPSQETPAKEEPAAWAGVELAL